LRSKFEIQNLNFYEYLNYLHLIMLFGKYDF